MFASFDAFLVARANATATWLQEEQGLTMPAILSHAAMATIVATGGAIVATFALRAPLIACVMLVLGSMTIVALWPLLMRYQRDSERGWSQGLARDYAVRAIGAQEGQRQMRYFGLALAMLVVGITSIRSAVDLVDVLSLLLVASSVAHLYFACAEPKPPGTRRTETRLAFQVSR
jgi:hypothetical protein